MQWGNGAKQLFVIARSERSERRGNPPAVKPVSCVEVELTVTFNNNIRPMWVDWIATLPLVARNDMSRFRVLVSKW